MPGKPFQKGQSGNPGGRPKEVADVRAAARKHTAMAIETLAEIARSGDSDRARAAAAQALLDRGWGKPSQPLTGEDGGALTIRVEYADEAPPKV